MSKIIVTVGISNSGKSTYSSEVVQSNPNDYVRVNRDDIRALLFGYTDETVSEYYNREDIHKLEKQVTKYEDTLINEALEEDKYIIIDSTNLKKSYIDRYTYWNVPMDVLFFPVTLKEALTRDKGRVRKVGEEVITKQYSRFLNLYTELGQQDIIVDYYTPTYVENTMKESKCWIFDIDGTLAHKGDRSPYDWMRVGQDTPDEAVIESTALCRASGAKVIICTGRDEICIEETEKWLAKYGVKYDELYIREKGNSEPDWVIKERMWREIAKRHYIFGMFDDRLQVVRRARALGLKVFNVEYNNF